MLNEGKIEKTGTVREIAEKYGVSAGYVSQLKNEKRRKTEKRDLRKNSQISSATAQS